MNTFFKACFTAASILGASVAHAADTVRFAVTDIDGMEALQREMGPFKEAFEKASESSSEKTWRMPLAPAYDRLLDSPTADMKNSMGRDAGSVTAAQFLQRFVGDVPWVHLDIAGTATKNTRTDPREPSFATGYGVRLLSQWIAENYEG